MSTTTVEDLATALNVMFWGTFYPTLAVLPQMRARRSGRVVNMTSIGGMVSVPHLLPYTCARFAAVGLSEGLRAELGQEGIYVTTVLPGLMRTRLLRVGALFSTIQASQIVQCLFQQ
jgi:short-subunit dehydrogenase